MNNETSFSDLTIIIPTLNEEKSIGILLKDLENEIPQASVIVADDGSEDKTKEITEAFEGNLKITFLDRKEEEIHGLTISVLDSIKICETEYFLVMDGDMQHPPSKIKEFYKLLKGNYELVGGKRIEVVGGWSLYRKAMSIFATWLGKIILVLRGRNRLKDIMSGFFASKTQIWKDFIEANTHRFELRGYKVLFDFLRSYPTKLKIGEVQYTFGTRNLGESKISSKVIWLYFRSLFKR